MPALPLRYRTQLAHSIICNNRKGSSLDAAHEFIRNVINGEFDDDGIVTTDEGKEVNVFEDLDGDKLTNEILFGMMAGEYIADIMTEDKIELHPDMELRVQRGKLIPGVKHRVIVDLMEEGFDDE